MKDLETIAQLLLSPDESSKELALFLIKSQEIDIDSLDSYLSRLAFTIIIDHLKSLKWVKGRHFETDHYSIGLVDNGIFLYVRTTRLTYYGVNIYTDLEVWSNDSIVIEYELKPNSLDDKKKLYRAVEKLTQEIINHLKTL